MKARQMIFDDPVGGTGLPAYGTEVLVNILNQVGGLPTRNWQDGYFPNADKTGGEALAAKQLVRKKGCFSCIISCGRVTKVDAPGFEGIGEGPEYETAWAYGADCGVDNLDAITKANYLCNEYGMDTIASGSSIACAMELFQRGIVTTEDTDGVDLSWGNAKAIVEMTRKMGEGDGFGAKLAQGSYRLADGYGHPEYSMTAKKQEMPAYDGRAIQGIGLNYATSNRGGCHVRGYTISHEVLQSGGSSDPHVTDGKAGLDIAFQNLTAALDATGVLPVRHLRAHRRAAGRACSPRSPASTTRWTSSCRPATASGTRRSSGTWRPAFTRTTTRCPRGCSRSRSRAARPRATSAGSAR